ncbi:MAG: potassium transporter TrkG [Pseudomonadota bacterium]
MAWDRVPLFLYLCVASGLSMLPIALLATTDGDFEIARPFFYGGVLVVAVSVMIALTLVNQAPKMVSRQHLLALLGAFTLLPVILAVPMWEALPNLRPMDAYLEMVSAISTTGLTVQPDPELWPRAIHLWRAHVAWMGGLLIWITTLAILAPLRIGGYEMILPPRQDGKRDDRLTFGRTISLQLRLWRIALDFVWIYAGLTFALWLGLMVVGETPFIALCHAMSTIATSGISPVGGLQMGEAGTWGEVLVFGFFIFAITRASLSPSFFTSWGKFSHDPELRVAVAVIVMVTAVLFIRHWYALVETAELIGLELIPRAVWGAVFTSASFLTTTGFVSENWEIARVWSGLSTPGMVLLGLALVGGGTATTAGGVKLLRIYVLYKHGQREVSRLVHPSAVGGIGSKNRPVRQEAAFMAWLFFMLFALSIALTMMALGFAGVDFEPATVLTLAAISNTGPLVEVAAAEPMDIVGLSDPVKLILCCAMTLGRLETLAIIALLNPDFWRA